MPSFPTQIATAMELEGGFMMGWLTVVGTREKNERYYRKTEDHYRKVKFSGGKLMQGGDSTLVMLVII